MFLKLLKVLSIMLLISIKIGTKRITLTNEEWRYPWKDCRYIQKVKCKIIETENGTVVHYHNMFMFVFFHSTCIKVSLGPKVSFMIYWSF